MAQSPANDPPGPPAGPAVPGQPPLPPGHGGIMVSFSPDWQKRLEPLPRWQRWFQPAPEFRVDRKRWRRAVYPVTFLTAPAGLRRVRLAERTGLGTMILVQVHINVYPGQWRQLAIGPQTIRPGKYPAPPVVDERGVEVNTAARRGRRMAILGLLVFLLPVAGFVATCLLGPYLLDRL